MPRFVMSLLGLSLALLLVALSASAALAVTNFANAPQGAHYAQGSGEPVCTIDQATDTVSCTGTEIAGVGNTNATVALTVEAEATVLCSNPSGKVVEPHTTTVTETTETEVFPTKNGRIIIPAQSGTITPEDVDAAFTCPNPNWSQEVSDVTITGFTYTVTFAGFEEPVIALP